MLVGFVEIETFNCAVYSFDNELWLRTSDGWVCINELNDKQIKYIKEAINEIS